MLSSHILAMLLHYTTGVLYFSTYGGLAVIKDFVGTANSGTNSSSQPVLVSEHVP